MTASSPSHRGSVAQRASSADRIWTLRLLGTRNAKLDLAVSACLVGALAWTRFAFLPSGPWEWDETLLARGILKFDLHAHFPHPPGFPLWLALGWLAQHVVSEPLRGLQLLSALSSVLSLWPLAAIARRAAPAYLATTTALVFLMLPGVWLYANRAFADTPATFFALLAAAIACQGLGSGMGGREATAFTLTVTASFLIRPILLPPLLALWAAGALTVRERRKLLAGVVVGATAVVVSVLAMLALQGSWTRFAEAFTGHASRHARGLVENVAGFGGLGVVSGTGGVWTTTALLAFAVIGLAVWARRAGASSARAWAVVLTVSVVQMVWLQDRTYPRYAIPVQLGAAPLVAAAMTAVAPPLVAGGGLLAIGSFLAVGTYSLVVEQHACANSTWAAVRFAAALANRSGRDLVVEPGVGPFSSYQEYLDRSRGKPWTAKVHAAPSPTEVRTLPAGAFLLVTDKPERYPATPFGRTWSFTCQSSELAPLTQGRFFRGQVIENAVVPVSGWDPVRRAGDRDEHLWGRSPARLLIPPVPAGASVKLAVEPSHGPAVLELRVNGASVATLPGARERTEIWLPPPSFRPGATNELEFLRSESYPVSAGGRLRAVRVSGLQLVGQAGAWNWRVGAAAEARRLGLEALAVVPREPDGATLTGLYPPETFDFGVGAWTEPVARLSLPGTDGSVTLTVAAPRPTPANLEVWVAGVRHAGPLALVNQPRAVQIFLDKHAPVATLPIELRSTPFAAARRTGQQQGRQLGVVITAIEGRPRSPRAGPGWIARLDRATRSWRFFTVGQGLHSPEPLYGATGAWTRPGTLLRFPAGPGTIALELASPRVTSPRLEVWHERSLLLGPLDLPSTPTVVRCDLPDGTPVDRPVELELRSALFVPSEHGSRDPRALGVVLLGVSFEPRRASGGRDQAPRP